MIYLNRGRRGLVYVSEVNGKYVVIKKKRKDSKAVRVLDNEAYWLKKLNKYGIGPKFIEFNKGELVMEFIKGKNFVDCYNKKLVRDVFNQCRVMDNLKVNKLEMHNPVKHIIVRMGKAILIDFERCKMTEKPKNVTQFCQFLLKLGFKVDRKKLKSLLKDYKKDYSENVFKKILKVFS